MSFPNSIQLTEEQQRFLSSLEEEFKNRYTENDEEFKAVLNEEPTMPPVVKKWVTPRYSGDRRNYRGMRGCDGGRNYPHSSKFYRRDYRATEPYV